jgi:hypothetical protein
MVVRSLLLLLILAQKPPVVGLLNLIFFDLR